MKTLPEQQAILEVLYQKPTETPKTPTSTFLIPKWQDIAPTYPEALQKVLDAIKATRPFYNWRSSEMDNFRETEGKVSALKKCKQTEDGKFYIVEAQMGQKWKGKSVKEVRASYDKNEFGLGAFEVASILLTHPEILQKYEDLWIDCPGDEFKPSDGRGFSYAPFFYFFRDKLRFVAHWVVAPHVYYGSASGLVPQSNLDS